MIKRTIPLMALFLLVVLILISAGSALAATNSVPSSRLDQYLGTITANALKPPQCSALSLTSVVICKGGNCDGTGASELLLGTTGGERIRGRGGSDCILGGGGDDNLVGNTVFFRLIAYRVLP